LARIIRIVFGSVAGVMLVAALANFGLGHLERRYGAHR
jgi:hypothetical protein